MKEKTYLTIKEFSHLSGIKPANLRFYDQIGLLSPECRGENNYRCYTRQQLDTAYLIVSLREFDIGIEEIKNYAEGRTPERMLSLFELQEKRILSEISRLRRMRDIMRLHIDMAKDALRSGADCVKIEFREQESIFIGPDLAPDEPEDTAVITFYDYAAENGMELGYPFGAIVAQTQFHEESSFPVSKYFFRVKCHGNTIIPSGKYAVAYGRCAAYQPLEIYDKLLAFIKSNSLKVCGDVYETCPLNEIAIQDGSQYCVRLEVMVE